MVYHLLHVEHNFYGIGNVFFLLPIYNPLNCFTCLTFSLSDVNIIKLYLPVIDICAKMLYCIVYVLYIFNIHFVFDVMNCKAH